MATIDLDGTTRDFTQALNELIRVIQFRDRDRACCYDLSVTQCHALKGIAEGGGATVNELAAYLYLDKSTVSRVVDGLVAKGAVEKRRDPDDRRVVRLVATDEGRRIYARIEVDLMEQYGELLEEFDPAFRSAVVKLVRRLRKSLRSGIDVTGGTCCVSAARDAG